MERALIINSFIFSIHCTDKECVQKKNYIIYIYIDLNLYRYLFICLFMYICLYVCLCVSTPYQ